MGPLTVALIVGTTFVANLTFDMGVNALQNWYDTVYESAFWTPRANKDTPALRALAVEEKEIAKLLNDQDFDRDDSR
jgi:hypothetical protein